MTTALTPRVDLMSDQQFSAYMELVEARTDAHNLSDVALLREARLAGIHEIKEREALVEAVAKAWVGM